MCREGRSRHAAVDHGRVVTRSSGVRPMRVAPLHRRKAEPRARDRGRVARPSDEAPRVHRVREGGRGGLVRGPRPRARRAGAIRARVQGMAARPPSHRSHDVASQRHRAGARRHDQVSPAESEPGRSRRRSRSRGPASRRRSAGVPWLQRPGRPPSHLRSEPPRRSKGPGRATAQREVPGSLRVRAGQAARRLALRDQPHPALHGPRPCRGIRRRLVGGKGPDATSRAHRPA